MTLFSILKDILTDKTGKLSDEPDFERMFSPYMIARYLSMRKNLLPYAEFVNRNQTVLSAEQLYHYLINAVPKSQNSYIKYMKSAKSTKKSKK